jgi:RimJ/RimL family protein N-acetyltransferase
VTNSPPTRITVDDGYALRLLGISDASIVARSVRESLEHLQPWMPWAGEESTQESFQRTRLRGAKHKASKGTEWQYGLFPRGETSLAGSFGLMADKWPATIEIGYWVHVAETGRGLARRATRALTNASLALDGVTTVYIRCDEANVRSASIPRALGFTLVRTETRPPEAPAETGRLMVWERTEPITEALSPAEIRRPGRSNEGTPAFEGRRSEPHD